MEVIFPLKEVLSGDEVWDCIAAGCAKIALQHDDILCWGVVQVNGWVHLWSEQCVPEGALHLQRFPQLALTTMLVRVMLESRGTLSFVSLDREFERPWGGESNVKTQEISLHPHAPYVSFKLRRSLW